ncbi:MAG: hypothetical protein JWM39_257 [Parcubacteria group bacterium]|nr:hypothetical protein [Parcubacteria group bacterium]
MYENKTAFAVLFLSGDGGIRTLEGFNPLHR